MSMALLIRFSTQILNEILDSQSQSDAQCKLASQTIVRSKHWGKVRVKQVSHGA